MEIKKVERITFGPRPEKKFENIKDFDNGRYNPLLLCDYGMNIYEKGERIGYILKVRIPGYRGLPINQIARLDFEVNGERLPEECKYIWYDGRDFPISDIGTGRFDNEWMWKYQDYLTVFFKIPGGIEQGVYNVKYGIYLRDHYSTTAYCEKDVTIV